MDSNAGYRAETDDDVFTFDVPDDALERAAGGADGSAMTMAYTCLHGCTVWGNV
jgi:hypothetical protein